MAAEQELTPAAAELNLDRVRRRLIASGSALALKANTVNEAELEYRRFLILCGIDADLAMPSDLILADILKAHACDRTAFEVDCLHVARRIARLGPPLGEAELTRFESLYENTFDRRLHFLWSAHARSDLGHCSPSEISSAPSPIRLPTRNEDHNGPRCAETGWTTIHGLWEPGLVDSLESEAAALKGTAIPQKTDEYTVNHHRYLTSPRLQRYAYPGQLLKNLHESPDLVSSLRRITNLPLFPTRAAYVYYDRGGHIGLHTDIAQCAATLFLPLDPARPPPLYVRPDLMTAGPVELLSAARENGRIPRGQAIAYTRGVGILILGSRLPHCRPPASVPITLATLCFDSIK
ncbi:hypothetical protein [Actinomadura madurae]|uniref:hypothetical protein n=1 Tax=Actinomadura madurae TaxID=1993 RepID=UPI0020D240D7|nr:hypothetical protein [Actinomadura madurae]MCP9955467.1 hypothetical protein [Actinomadura madurae]MCP9972203.1 hypothetical protein [Actinomadura madurae]MCP9984706.1 hypothetical protein [Actinomadura madurae]MCQ0003744.1 hypothetical protein [Actinomadura madurae]MCQ0020897.1 hypothetical protein [Actinomadura madurae]